MNELRWGKDLVLTESLAAGRSHEVYKARRIGDDRTVVIKRSCGQRGMERARNEAEFLMRMRHSFLPLVYECHEREDAVYTIMEYIPGCNLRETVRRTGPIPSTTVMKWAEQLAQVLSYLHGRTPPIVHGDIKPSNIMLTPEGHICLIDFHIAQELTGRKGISFGLSRGYSPPEQYRSVYRYRLAAGISEVTGEDTSSDVTCTSCGTWTDEDFAEAETVIITADRSMEGPDALENDDIGQIIGGGIDERSDVYSLGATLYHLLTGKRPDTDFQCIVPINQCGVVINEEFAAIVRRMMSLQPQCRYRNGTELLQALERVGWMDTDSADDSRGSQQR